jgi:3-hydroxymyristoyl/3-hydroxydecanoyl-(acyl carrier protein) dehydratase
MPPSHDIRFAAEHPTAAGHFPGNPIIPGALLLDEVMRLLAAGGRRPAKIRSTKFFRPVRPGEVVRLTWASLPGAVTFECRMAADDAIAASGTVEVGPAAA